CALPIWPHGPALLGGVVGREVTVSALVLHSRHPCPFCVCSSSSSRKGAHPVGSGPRRPARARSAAADHPWAARQPGSATAPRAARTPLASSAAPGALPRRTEALTLHGSSAQPPPRKTR